MNRTRLSIPILALTFALSGVGSMAAAHHSEGAVELPSLYERIGGFDAIAAVVDDFIGRLVADESLGRFFTGHSTDSKGRIRQQIIEQVCLATGGPCVYTGRDTRTAHTGLGITEADWTRTVDHFVATLDKLQVPRREMDELLAIVGSLKEDIVGR
jgi:hemoglobin